MFLGGEYFNKIYVTLLWRGSLLGHCVVFSVHQVIDTYIVLCTLTSSLLYSLTHWLLKMNSDIQQLKTEILFTAISYLFIKYNKDFSCSKIDLSAWIVRAQNNCILHRCEVVSFGVCEWLTTALEIRSILCALRIDTDAAVFWWAY